MAVIIQEFEVVPETAPPPDANANRGEQSESPKKKEQAHPEDVFRFWHERAERVRAH